MLTKQDNALLCETGAGTAMGELFRRYWVPAMTSAELPEPDGAPVRMKLLGEQLIAFRDTNGAVGLVANACPHRGASMFFGRNEDAGLRCVYHGWKFDIEGTCTDMPNEPAESNFKHKIHLAAYPAVERGGVVWAYMGPEGERPPLPELEWITVPDEQRYVSRRLEECNWAQAMEGGIDSSHISFLHRDRRPPTDGQARQFSRGTQYVTADRSPRFEVAGTDYGLLIGARRNAEPGHYYWRITQWLAPWYTMIPPFGDAPIGGHAWVPADDETCWTWSFDWHPTRVLNEDELANYRTGGGIHLELVPGTFKPASNRENDYRIDRTLQKSGYSYTGIRGIGAQDNAMQESMGVVYDRSREHLGSSDTAIIAARRFLMRAAAALQGHGATPPGLDTAAQRVRSVSIVLPDSVSWPEGAKAALTATPGTYVIAV